MPNPHPESVWTITEMYSVPDGAWYLELDLVPGQRAVVTVIVPDEDPGREPTVHLDPPGQGLEVPYEVMRRFMDLVGGVVRTSRVWMRLRPDLVDVVHRLRREYLGVIGDEDFARVLPEIRAEVPEPDLPAVLAAAFRRNPDGTYVDHGDTQTAA